MENSNPSYETLIKRLLHFYEQSNDNVNDINSTEVDTTNLYLNTNWLTKIFFIDDTRDKQTKQDQPITPLAVNAVQIVDPAPYNQPYFISTDYDVVAGNPLPMILNYSYSNIISILTKELLPYLEFEGSFAIIGDTKYSSGFSWPYDLWDANYYIIKANGVPIWQGVHPPLDTAILISQYQVDNNFASNVSDKLYNLIFTSSIGGILGGGRQVAGPIISVYDNTTSTELPITADVLDIYGSDILAVKIWSQSNGEALTVLSTQMLTHIITLFDPPAYFALWPDGTPLALTISIGNLPILFWFPTSSASPISFIVNPDGYPQKYSDRIAQDNAEVLNNISSNQATDIYWVQGSSYDPYYVRQNKSTDKKEIWQVNYNFTGVATGLGVLSSPQTPPRWNNLYTFTGPSWTLTANETTFDLPIYKPITTDMTARVRVALKPVGLWHTVNKYQEGQG